MIPVSSPAYNFPLVAQLVGALFTTLTLAALAYSVLVFRATRSYTRLARTALPDFYPAVSILKPVKGLDSEMYAAFTSHCAQDYRGEYEILFGVHSMDDAAVAAIEKLQREFPQQAIRIVVCPQVLGTNGKVSNLVQMIPQARYDHLLINDSDIRVSPRYLRHTLPAFAIPCKTNKPVGMVTALYRGRSHGTLGSRLEALGIATDFMPGVLTARWLEKGMRFGLGSTLAVTRDALDAIGGLVPLVNYLADDYEIGARISAAGYRVELGREVAETSIPAYRFSQFVDSSAALGARCSRCSSDWLSRPVGDVWTALGAGEFDRGRRFARQHRVAEHHAGRAGGAGIIDRFRCAGRSVEVYAIYGCCRCGILSHSGYGSGALRTIISSGVGSGICSAKVN